MARAIDGDAVKRRVWDIAEAWKSQGRDYEALLLESVVEQIVDSQPTLAPQWISVGKQLPKYGTVLATDGSVVITAPSSSVTADGPAITHWMPLPEPPEAAHE